MTFSTLIRRSLRFHARAHVGVVLGAAIGSAALIGALLVGDSVRETLKENALARLGGIHFALSARDRLFQSEWGQDPFFWPTPGLIPSGRSGTFVGSTATLRVPSQAASPPRVLPQAVVSQQRAQLRPGPPSLPRMLPQPPDILRTKQGGPIGSPQSALLLPGLAATQDGSARANRVNVIGVDPFWRFSPNPLLASQIASALTNGAALINETLSRQLAVRPGDEIILRVRKPSALGLDAALSPRDQNAVALRLKVGAILSADKLGDFALTAQPAPPMNLFLSREFLARQVGVPDRANLLVYGQVSAARKLGWLDEQRDKLADWLRSRARTVPAGAGTYTAGTNTFRASRPDPGSLAARMANFLRPRLALPIPDPLALPWLQSELARAWLPEYTGLSVRAIEQPQTATGGEYIRPWIEVASSRVFLEPPVVAAALKPRTALLTDRPAFFNDTTNDVALSQFVTNSFGVLTYLANAIRAGDSLTPYSMVTAADGPFVPAGMSDDEILVNEWLAEDLQVKPGDTVALSYYLADSGSRLAERTNSFRVRAIVPVKGIYADRTLMPEFPGLAKAESTRDWDAGFPLVHKIRDKDEAYWKKYRGTPKAFITLAAGQALWANRFGSLTAIRYPVPTNSFASSYREAAYHNLVANLNPADLGFRLEPVREEALKAAGQSQDFGQLFLGFSFFLVLAALLLMALLFQFGLEQRAAEVGTLLALGFTAKQVRRLLLAEGAALAFLGGVLGALGGLAYARAMLWGLATAWRNAVGAAPLHFHASPLSLVAGLGSSTLVAALTIWLTLRKQARQPIRDLLESTVHSPQSTARSPKSPIFNFQSALNPLRPLPCALLAGAAALCIVGWALAAGQQANAGAFFGAGALLLVSGLGFLASWLRALARPGRASRLTVSSLGVRSCARRRGRSLATAALLASGCFVIAAIGVFRLDANRDATRRDSGTGGFALLGESTLPVAQDLNTKAGLEAFGLGTQDLAGARVVPFRLREGDEASCLNLNRAQQPRLLGVNPDLLAGRFTFAAVAKGNDRRMGWELLNQSKAGVPIGPIGLIGPQPEIPAIGDANSIEWALGKELGETIGYRDEEGRMFKVKLVGAVANSILQGSLIIDEAQFVKRFPNESGYRMFLIDAPSNSVRQVSASLSRALQDAGLELMPTAERLNAFNAVQNTYLGTFQILGGLGLLLGSAGLGVVVLRNVLERRGELGLLAAVGFRRRTLQAMVLSEHGALLALGLGLGVIAAAVAVLPSLLTPGATLPYRSLALTLGAVFLNGALWTWLATRYSLRGNLLDTLRNE
jgi:ABC-type antimicrobial peptide transport system permease subunit